MSLRRLGRTFEVLGLLQKITSFTSPTLGAGSVVNDVERVYNSFAQLVTEYQEHSGAVNTSTSANVQYRYADGSANTIRPTALVYPNALTRVLNYSYGTSGGMDDALSRVASLIDNDGSTHLADYTRLGLGTFVQQASPQPNIAWSLINGSGSDPYTGLDQFDRVVDNRWYSTATSTDLDRIQHGYDTASNRLWRKNTVADAAGVYLDELYSHDGLYRLSEAQRGQLNSSNNGLVSGTLGFAQAWGLDATGNWSQFWENDSGSSWDLQQTRTSNKVNEITGISGGGWIVPSYDSAGNAVQTPIPDASNAKYMATYDAWNRLVSVYEDGTTLISINVYDGMDRRVTETSYGSTRHFYHTASWQVIEERLGTSAAADRQFVWGLRYIDDLILRDCSDYTPARLYALQDPNWNVTSILDSTGAVKERYDYAAYGQPAFYQASFSGLVESSFGWETLYAGYRYDVILFYYLARHRWLDYLTGRWLTRDPFGADDARSQFEYSSSSPIAFVDPLGLVPVAAPLCAGCFVFTGLLIDIAAETCTDEYVDIHYGGSLVLCMLEEYDKAYDALPAVTRAAAVVACLCCGGVVKKAIKKAASKVAKKRLKNKIAKCVALWQAYKAAEKAAIGCKAGLPCAAYAPLVAARTSEVAGRTAYLKMKCDYVLPGSIKRGPKKAEAGHKKELAEKSAALAKCIQWEIAACAPAAAPPSPKGP